MRWHGLDIEIEVKKGGTRSADDGSWKVENLPADYGFIAGTRGADSEEVDVYVVSNEASPVWVIDQVNADTGKFDEHKAVLGAPEWDKARRVYERGFSDGRGPDRIGGVRRMTVSEFKVWLHAGRLRRPASSPRLPGVTD